MEQAPYTISEARYAKGKMVIRPNDDAGIYKGRSAYLADAIGGRWVNRSRGYVVSAAAANKFEILYAAGFDADARVFASTPATFRHAALGLRDLTAAQAVKVARNMQNMGA